MGKKEAESFTRQRIAIPALGYMKKAFMSSNMTGKEKGLHFILVLILFTEWQPEKYYNDTFMQSCEECYGGALFENLFKMSFPF